MQIALDVTELDELRQLALARSLELTCVLPQLGRDELVAELFVHLRLVGERQLFARLDHRDGVLRDGQALLHRTLAQGHVVVLRAGEVLQQIPV